MMLRNIIKNLASLGKDCWKKFKNRMKKRKYSI